MAILITSELGAGGAEHRVPRPSKPGFVMEEAKQLLGMCVVANYLGPVVFEPFPPGLIATDNPHNPLPDDDGKTYPYPHHPIWPEGWTPGVPSKESGKPWANSILTSHLSNGLGVDSAIFSYNAGRNAYAVAFAGTLNPGSAIQDLCAILIPAGPVQLGYFNSQENYAITVPDSPVEPAGGLIEAPLPEPAAQIPRVHLGYRQALESLTVLPDSLPNLKSILAGLEGEEIDLYVTGHSLGAALAQLFSAWIKAGGVPSKKINVKCYSFATPKSVNVPMASNYDLALSNSGFSYCVANTLDTAPQLPPTTDATTDLINPDISTDLQSKADPNGAYQSSPLAPIARIILGEPSEQAPSEQAPPANEPSDTSAVPMNFVAMGIPHILAALPPVVYNGRCYPPEFFPARDPTDLVDIPDTSTREWWQHWPFNYAKYLSMPAELAISKE